MTIALTDFERRILEALGAICTERDPKADLNHIGSVTPRLKPGAPSASGFASVAIRPEGRAWLEASGGAA
jgi:hypothetical protein